jgi:hypothetical protein
VGLEVHDEHQHRDELLARRGGEPQRVCRAAVPDDPRARRPGRGRGARKLRRTRLGAASEHRPLARRRTNGRPELGGFTTGGLARHPLWEHYLFTGDRPSCASTTRPEGLGEFFLDFLVRNRSTAGSSPTLDLSENYRSLRQRPVLRRGDGLRSAVPRSSPDRRSTPRS